MITLIPYVEVNGNRSFSDDSMRSIHHRMMAEGTLRTVFNGGKSEDEFVSYMKSRDNLPVIIMVDDEVSAIAWLNHIEHNHANAHFCVFRSIWGEKSFEVGKKVLDYWFSFPGDNGPLFDVLLGVIPSFNQKAIRFIEKLGFTIVGEIPKLYENNGEVEPVTISYVLRNEHG